MSLKKLAAIGLPLWYTFPEEHLSKLKRVVEVKEIILYIFLVFKLFNELSLFVILL